MKSGIFDIDGVEVTEGCLIAIPYITPMGKVDLDTVNSYECVVFKHGCFGYDTKTKFIPLFELSEVLNGNYIPNNGVEKIITDKYIFRIFKKQEA